MCIIIDHNCVVLSPVVIQLINLLLHIRVHPVRSVVPLKQTPHEAHAHVPLVALLDGVEHLAGHAPHTKVWHVEPRVWRAGRRLGLCSRSPPRGWHRPATMKLSLRMSL